MLLLGLALNSPALHHLLHKDTACVVGADAGPVATDSDHGSAVTLFASGCKMPIAFAFKPARRPPRRGRGEFHRTPACSDLARSGAGVRSAGTSLNSLAVVPACPPACHSCSRAPPSSAPPPARRRTFVSERTFKRNIPTAAGSSPTHRSGRLRRRRGGPAFAPAIAPRDGLVYLPESSILPSPCSSSPARCASSPSF